MDLSAFVVQALNGLAGASSLFLVSAGLSLIFGVTRIVNFAHGSFFMLGIYIAYSLVEHIGRSVGLAVSFWWLLLLAALISGMFTLASIWIGFGSGLGSGFGITIFGCSSFTSIFGG